MKTTLSTIAAALKLVLSDLAQLGTPAIASSVAGAVAGILGLLGVNFPLGVIVAWVTAVGTVAGVIEKIVTGQAAAAVAKK